jgi:hypothetical protein
MTDPLADVIGLLHPRVVLWKQIEGSGRWALRFEANPDVNFGVVTTGHCWLQCEGGPVGLAKGDFLLLSGPPAFTFSSDIGEDSGGDVVDADRTLAGTQDNHLRLGSEGGPAVQLLAGHFAIEPENADLLLDLLPTVVHLRAGTDGAGRIASLLELIGDEAGADRPGASLVLTRLVEVMLVEALRSAPATLEQPPASLLAGLGDPPGGGCPAGDPRERRPALDSGQPGGRGTDLTIGPGRAVRSARGPDADRVPAVLADGHG